MIGAIALSGCSPQRPVVEDSSIVIAAEQHPSTLNAATRFALAAPAADANAMLADATRSSFVYYDDTPKLVVDESFGSTELISEDPLVVRFTIADKVVWSDGTRIDAADLLLAWAAKSGTFNEPDFDPAEFTDPESGALTDDVPKDVVWFDANASAGLELVTDTPELSADRRSLTLHFDKPFVDWRLAMSVDVPAHVVAAGALDVSDEREAKDAVIDAIQTNDTATLAELSRFWNSGFGVAGMPDDESVLVSSGPYLITGIEEGEVTLAANPRYSGVRMPHIETITVRTIPDGLAAVEALDKGEVQVISPQPTVDVIAALDALPVTVRGGTDASFEHIDLQFDKSRNGHFSDPRVREAFLKVVPRREILDTLIRPLNPGATMRDSNLLIPGAPGYGDAAAANGSADFAAVDVDGAVRLLAAAGVAHPEVCILYSEANPRRMSEFALIQKSAALAGFVVTDCSSPDWKELLGEAGRYDAALFGWQATGLGVTSAALQYGTGAPNNVNYYSNDTVDALLVDVATTFGSAHQLALLAKIDAALFDDYYGLPLFQYPRVVAFDPTAVRGISLAPLPPGPTWNLWDWRPVAGS